VLYLARQTGQVAACEVEVGEASGPPACCADAGSYALLLRFAPGDGGISGTNEVLQLPQAGRILKFAIPEPTAGGKSKRNIV